jgi:hypothetical protein
VNHATGFVSGRIGLVCVAIIAGLAAPGCLWSGLFDLTGLPGSTTIDYLTTSDAILGGEGRLRVTLVDPVLVDTVVSLASSVPSIVAVPETATIPAGSDNVEVAFSGLTVGHAQITVTLDDSSQSTPVSVVGAMVLSSIDADDPVLAGFSAQLSVALGSTAASDVTVSLSSSDPAVLAVPATVVVPKFERFQDVAVTTGATGTATITATLGSSTVMVTVTVVDTVLVDSIYLQSGSWLSVGSPAEVLVFLNTFVKADTIVSLSSSDPGVVAIPASVTVPAGSRLATVTLTPLAAGTATITASLNGGSQSEDVRVIGVPTIEFLSLPPRLQEGEAATLRIYLDFPAPADSVVGLTSTFPQVLAVPESVTIPAGQYYVELALTPLISGSTLITASLGDTSLTYAVSVSSSESPAPIAMVNGPEKMEVGAVSTIRINLSASAQTDTLVTFTNSDPAVVAVPASMTVPAHDTLASVPVQGLAAGTANVEVAVLGETFTVTVQVVESASVLPIWPAYVAVGESDVLYINVDAVVAADRTLTLTNSDPDRVQVPASAVIRAGESSVTVPILGLAATASDATITVTLGDSSESTTVTVVP